MLSKISQCSSKQYVQWLGVPQENVSIMLHMISFWPYNVISEKYLFGDLCMACIYAHWNGWKRFKEFGGSTDCIALENHAYPRPPESLGWYCLSEHFPTPLTFNCIIGIKIMTECEHIFYLLRLLCSIFQIMQDPAAVQMWDDKNTLCYILYKYCLTLIAFLPYRK